VNVYGGDQEETCFFCHNELATQRTGEDHFGVGMGDIGGFRVTLDGVDVSNDTFEALAGEDGWVIVHLPVGTPKGLCPVSRQHPYAVLRRGRVTVQAPPRPLPSRG